MNQKSGNRVQTHGSNLFRKSPSVQQLREEVRKQFKEKLRLGRSQELYKRRDIYKSVISNIQKHFSDIHENLLEGNEEEVMDIERILRVLVEVEEELHQNESQRQAEQYALHFQEHTNALLENLSVCTICNKFIDFEYASPNVICDQCAKLHFNSEIL